MTDRRDVATPDEPREAPRITRAGGGRVPSTRYDRAKLVLDETRRQLCAYCLAKAIEAPTARRAFVQLEGHRRFQVRYGPCADCGQQRLVIGVRRPA
jgi:hypothetical protein